MLSMKQIERFKWRDLVGAAYQADALSAHTDRLFSVLPEREVRTVVESAVHDYVNDPGLCSEDEDEFPSRVFLTGRYYLRRLADHGIQEGRRRLLVSCACLGIEVAGQESDYLGLDVRLSLSISGHELRVDRVDSFVM